MKFRSALCSATCARSVTALVAAVGLASVCTATTVNTTTIGGDDITGNTRVIIDVTVVESDPTVPSWAKAEFPPTDYSTNNTELVATIEAVAPTPGDYAAVSNAAMNALSRSEAETDLAEKANKSELSVTPGTGANADKTTIQLKSGTSATVLTTHQQLSPIYGGNGEAFGDWKCSPSISGSWSVEYIDTPGAPFTGWGLIINGAPYRSSGPETDINATTLTVSTPATDYTLSRTLNSIVGYTLGTQDGKVLASTNRVGIYATTNELHAAVTNIEEIIAGIPRATDYATVSNAAMNALSRAEAEAGSTVWTWTNQTGSVVSGLPDPVWNGQVWIWAKPEGYEDYALELDGHAYTEYSDALYYYNADQASDTLTASRVRIPTMSDLAEKADKSSTYTTNEVNAAIADALTDRPFRVELGLSAWTVSKAVDGINYGGQPIYSDGVWTYAGDGGEICTAEASADATYLELTLIGHPSGPDYFARRYRLPTFEDLQRSGGSSALMAYGQVPTRGTKSRAVGAVSSFAVTVGSGLQLQGGVLTATNESASADAVASNTVAIANLSTNITDVAESATNYTDAAIGTLSEILSNDVEQASTAYSRALDGVRVDFSTLAGLYVAISNLLQVMGGSVTNFPSVQ